MDAKYDKDQMLLRIENLLRADHLNYKEFAERIGVPAVTVYKWFQRRSTPQLGSIVSIAKAFGVTTDYLLTGKELTGDEILIRKVQGSSVAERKLLSQYEQMPENYQQMVSAYTDGIALGLGISEEQG